MGQNNLGNDAVNNDMVRNDKIKKKVICHLSYVNNDKVTFKVATGHNQIFLITYNVDMYNRVLDQNYVDHFKIDF